MPIIKNCTVCDKPLGSEREISCDKCRLPIHTTCSGLTRGDIQLLLVADKKRPTFHCDICTSERKTMSELKVLISKLSMEVETLKQKVKQGSFEEIVEEINQRNIRRFNLIVFGVEEQDQQQPNTVRIENDKKEVTNIVNFIDTNLDISNFKLIRIGSFTAGKTRPIKIVLDEEKHVHNLIRKAHVLKNNASYNQIAISFDRTPKQIDYYRNVKKQLDDRKNNGEKDIKIKYINGIPKIVSLN